MKHFLSRVSTATVLLLIATSCNGEPTHVWLQSALQEQGVTVSDKVQGVSAPFFSTDGRELRAEAGEFIQVFEFPSRNRAEDEAGNFAADGTSEFPEDWQWERTPHLYRRGRAIILYTGDNEKVLTALQTLLGPAFAEGRRSGSGAVTSL